MIIATTNQQPDELTFEKARKGTLFEENGLWGLKNEDGSILRQPKFLFIGKCSDKIIFIEPNWYYEEYCSGSDVACGGTLDEYDRPFFVNGKAGFKKNGNIVVPAIYDYLEVILGYKDKPGRILLAVKDNKTMYFDENGKEVLTRVRHFAGDEKKGTPFHLCTNSFDIITVEKYIGHPQADNPNVVNLCGQWVELERYCKEEIMQMLIDPADDLALTEENLQYLCSPDSYDYDFYIANAQGEQAFKKCMEQFEKMCVYWNPWYYVVKIWLAPGEQLQVKELREFVSELKNVKSGCYGQPVLAVGHNEQLKSGEVRMLMITYHNGCEYSHHFEDEWHSKVKELPVSELQTHIPWLREEIKKNAEKEEYGTLADNLWYNCISGLKYYEEQSWEDARDALEFFLQIGSPIDRALHSILLEAQSTVQKNNSQAFLFYLKAALWVLGKGGKVNEIRNNKTSLDILYEIMKDISEEEVAHLKKLEYQMLQKGAKVYQELEEERETNTDYFKELEYMQLDLPTKVEPSPLIFD